jgi:hypothetical protein
MEPDLERMHARARRMFDVWHNLRPAPDLLPGRQHFDPALVPTLLSNIALLDVVRDPLRFRYRVVGSSLNLAGFPAKAGDWFHDLLQSIPGSRALDSFIPVATMGMPDWYFATRDLERLRNVTGIERLVLPLARDGRLVDMLLTLTLYHHRNGRVT